MAPAVVVAPSVVVAPAVVVVVALVTVVIGAGVVPPPQMWIRPMLESSAFLQLEKESRQEDLAVLTFNNIIIRKFKCHHVTRYLVKLVLSAALLELGLLHQCGRGGVAGAGVRENLQR